MTRGEQMLALRRSRMAASPALLRGGFRPFFLGGAVWAVVALGLWLSALTGGHALPSLFDPLAWHRHEMLFGFVGAVIAGFLLTAVPNWTGRLPIAGPPLAALFALWVAGRAAMLFSATTGPAPAFIVDVAFLLVLAALAAREVLAAKNRNVPIVGLVLLLAAVNAADHAGAVGLVRDTEIGVRGAIALVTVMISLIGGRIIPSFTRNWMAKQGVKNRLPTQPGRFDLIVIAATAAAMTGWTALPDSRVVGLGLAGAGLLQAVRLARWRGWRAARDPLVLILHVGYAWLPIGLLLLGASLLDPAVPRTAAIHALTAGAMGTMILAVMSRATLGHTGRPLEASPATTFLYALVTFGAVVRVVVALGWGGYDIGMAVSGTAWAGAFLIFIAAYGPILMRPRVGEAA